MEQIIEKLVELKVETKEEAKTEEPIPAPVERKQETKQVQKGMAKAETDPYAETRISEGNKRTSSRSETKGDRPKEEENGTEGAMLREEAEIRVTQPPKTIPTEVSAPAHEVQKGEEGGE
ncbi:hypothetical protein BLNAU_4028 [Blattamonas nauphoetae]|uniref:Uncharacterized protein n=1 Tax=Blattamonas nauphoetae TaxID=2049346 RepID=A0ABQ9YAZ0_9EUKA|nr:hypothetical protein BLNAU_4028 [Blattamonas nauphoetae]